MTDTRRAVTIWAEYGPYHLARVHALEDAGWDVIGYSYSATGSDYEFFREEPKQHRMINAISHHSANAVMSWWRTLVNLRRDRPDLVLACGYERPETLAAIIYGKTHWSRYGQRPMVVMMLDNQIDDKPRKRLVEAIKRLYLATTDGFLVGGSTHIKYLTSLGVQASRLRTGCDCVDNERIGSAAEALRASGLGNQFSNYFLTLSRLVPKKNIGSLIHAYATYRLELPHGLEPWALVIAGDGPELRSLKDLSATYKLGDQVHFAGRVDSLADAVRYYAFCQVFILASSQSEQWGLVVNEAMAAGVPVLVSGQCGCSSHLVKDGRNGFSFDGNSIRQLADRMLWMHLHADQLPSMGRESKAIVSDYSPARFASAVEDLYGSLGPGMAHRSRTTREA